MPDNYKALKELEDRAFVLLCETQGVETVDIGLFNSAHSAAVKAFPELFRVGEEPGENPRAPHHKAYTIMRRLRSFLAMEMGIDLGTYEEAIRVIE